jgi:myo-inositol 2-dehydrogenase / D-chiro-inositol 1-dehydrogenase
MAFRICLVGCGGMARNGHGPMLRKYAAMNPDVELAACCDISRERAEAFAAEFVFKRWFDNMDDMMDAVKPDGALLAVPIELTADLSIRILKRRIPLLTEKPPGISVLEGQAIVAAAEASGVPVSAAFNRRSMPLVETLAREINAVGTAIESISIEMCRLNRREKDFSMTAIHDVDLARHLCGSDYSRAEFIYSGHSAESGADPAADSAAGSAVDIGVLACMESGAVVNLGFYPMCGSVTERLSVRLQGHLFQVELPVFGSRDCPGRIVHIAGNSIVDILTGRYYEHEAEANGFLSQIAHFFDAVREERIPRHSVGGSLQSLALACCISGRESSFRKAKGPRISYDMSKS